MSSKDAPSSFKMPLAVAHCQLKKKFLVWFGGSTRVPHVGQQLFFVDNEARGLIVSAQPVHGGLNRGLFGKDSQ